MSRVQQATFDIGKILALIGVIAAVLLKPETPTPTTTPATPAPVVAPAPGPSPAPVVNTPAPAPVPVSPAPTPAPSPTVKPERVIVTDSTGVRIADSALEEALGKLLAGTWRVEGIPAPGQKGFVRTVTVVEGTTPAPVPVPTPAPVPPTVPPPVQPQPPDTTPAPAPQPTAATFFFEKDQHAIPGPVLAALNKLNRRGIVATVHEVDATDGAGQVPDQYKVSLPAARSVGIPSLVVMAGDKVLKVLKDPKTEEIVLEAVP